MFEHSLIDLETKQPSRGRGWTSLPIAIALHLAGLAVFALGTAWNVGVVLEPKPIDVVTLVLPPPLPSSDSEGHPKSPQPKPDIKPGIKPEVKPDKPMQPTPDTVPDKPPVPASTPPIDSSENTASASDGPGHGHGNGDGSGEREGFGDGSGEQTSIVDSGGDVPSLGEDLPVRLSVGMTRPEPIYKVEPRYTQAAQRAGIEGNVIVEAVIDEQGRVTGVHVLHGLPLGLDRNAVEAIQQWRFKPALRGDKPVKVYFVLTTIFRIKR